MITMALKSVVIIVHRRILPFKNRVGKLSVNSLWVPSHLPALERLFMDVKKGRLTNITDTILNEVLYDYGF